jgi:phosphohistidine phosphatase SixA
VAKPGLACAANAPGEATVARAPVRRPQADAMQLKVGLLVGVLLLQLAAGSTAAELAQWERFKRGQYVLLIRHALAPGNGDPTRFLLDDCTTQRNLDDTGRAQARRIGKYLKVQGVKAARVLSSQWCRCLETARLLEAGPVAELAALNSFYELPQTRAPNLRALKAFLVELPSQGRPVILVTHYVTIAATTGQHVGSGEGVFAHIESDGTLRFEALASLR